MDVMKEYRQMPAAVDSCLDTKARVRASLQTEACGPQRTPVEQPQPRCGSAMWVLEDNTACYCQEKKLGQYRSLSLSPPISHPLQKYQPFGELSVRDVYFYKEVCSFVRSFVHWRSQINVMIMGIQHQGWKINARICWERGDQKQNGEVCQCNLKRWTERYWRKKGDLYR